MSKEHEGIFVIQYKNFFNGYQPYVDKYGSVTLDCNYAKLFTTRSEAYKYALDKGLEKKCTVEEIK